MRSVILVGSAALLAGCVQQPPPYLMQPYPLQAAPPLPYQTDPMYRPPMPAPQDVPTPVPLIAPDLPPASVPAAPAPDSDSGALPLQDLPAPAPQTGGAPASGASGAAAAPAPAPPSRMPSAASPVAGHGSNVPLEGFRPMRTQTQPTP